MKQLLSMIVIVGTLTIITFSSCKKEDYYVAPATHQQDLNLDLVANSWVNYDHETYMDTFQGILGTANASGNRTVLVYLAGEGYKVQLSQRHITYQGNEMWATNTATDVSIFYHCKTRMPFNSVNIRVEIR
jgi:hypothetical protein